MPILILRFLSCSDKLLTTLGMLFSRERIKEKHRSSDLFELDLKLLILFLTSNGFSCLNFSLA